MKINLLIFTLLIFIYPTLQSQNCAAAGATIDLQDDFTILPSGDRTKVIYILPNDMATNVDVCKVNKFTEPTRGTVDLDPARPDPLCHDQWLYTLDEALVGQSFLDSFKYELFFRSTITPCDECSGAGGGKITQVWLQYDGPSVDKVEVYYGMGTNLSNLNNLFQTFDNGFTTGDIYHVNGPIVSNASSWLFRFYIGGSQVAYTILHVSCSQPLIGVSHPATTHANPTPLHGYSFEVIRYLTSNGGPSGLDQGGFRQALVETPYGSAYDIATVYIESNAFLPLAMTRFEGKAEDKAIQLRWSTAQESNLLDYEVERSRNGQDFQSIGKVAALNVAQNQEYGFKDPVPYNGNNYYRLRINEINGRYDYSQTIMVSQSNRTHGLFRLFPMPANDYLVLQYTGALNVNIKKVELFDQVGASVGVFPVRVRDVQYSEVDVSKLASGMYIARIIDQDNTEYLSKVLKL